MKNPKDIKKSTQTPLSAVQEKVYKFAIILPRKLTKIKPFFKEQVS